jgi:lycopene beta-cyclase
MVHPATGFMLARCLAAAAPFAEAIVAALRVDSPQEAARAGWDALWTPDRLIARTLHLYGASALAGMHEDELRAFFRAFFALPPARWQSFLDGGGAGATASTMLTLFLAAPSSVRSSLVTRALFPAPHVPRVRAPVPASLPEVS